MAEELTMVKDATPKKVALVTKPYSKKDRINKDEEELKQLLEEQKNEATKTDDTGNATEQDADTAEPDNAEERTFKKRYGDLRKHQQQQQKLLEDQIETLKSQLEKTASKEIKLPKTEEELETWAKEYPDVAAIVETIAMKKAKEQSQNIESRMKEFENLREEATKEKAEAELLTLHPDFSTIRDSDDFHTWAEEQPKWVQDALYENQNDARSASRAIDLYKADKNISKKTSSDKDAAKPVSTRSTRSEPQSNESKSYLKESDVQKMSAQEYEKRADEVMEAIRSGKFTYDLSGSAR